jgi:hypothetical protein
MTRATIVQTADPKIYAEMIAATAEVTFEYCRRHGIDFECIIGVKRGAKSWHATYNRIVILKEYLETGKAGWVIYLDADAIIVDLEFNVYEYLETKKEFAAIFIPSLATDNFWDVNAGVFAINLDNPAARSLIVQWHNEFMSISDEELNAMTWEAGMNDQDLLHKILREEEATFRGVIYLESPNLMNSLEARFVQQVLRSNESDITTRVDRLIVAARRVLRPPSDDAGRADAEDEIIAAVYRALLRRDPDKAGVAHYRNLLRTEGLRAGLSSMLRGVLKSEERAALEKRDEVE